MKSQLASYHNVSEELVIIHDGPALKNVFDAFWTRAALSAPSKRNVFVLGPMSQDLNQFIPSEVDVHTHIPDNIWKVNAFCDVFFPASSTDNRGEVSESQYDLIYINNPNDSTGVLYSTDDIFDLASTFPNAFFIINESYYDFSERYDFRGKALEEFMLLNNLIIVRKFKPRSGGDLPSVEYTLSSKWLSNSFLKSYDTPSKEEQNMDISKVMREETRVDNTCRDWFSKALVDLGVKVYTGNSNFVVVNHKKSKEILEELSNSDILINDMSTYPQMKDCIKVGIGGGRKMELVLSEIRRRT